MAITIAEKVLIAGGVLNLAYGTLLGYPITVIRAKGAPVTPRYLMATHVSTLLHAAVLLGLARAARLSALGPGWHDVAAWLLVISSALVAAKDTLNWLTGVQDEFGEKAKTAPLGALGALGGNSWCRHLRRRHPHSAVTSGVNALVSLAHIGMCGKPVWLRRLHLGLLNRSIH